MVVSDMNPTAGPTAGAAPRVWAAWPRATSTVPAPSTPPPQGQQGGDRAGRPGPGVLAPRDPREHPAPPDGQHGVGALCLRCSKSRVLPHKRHHRLHAMGTILAWATAGLLLLGAAWGWVRPWSDWGLTHSRASLWANHRPVWPSATGRRPWAVDCGGPQPTFSPPGAAGARPPRALSWAPCPLA